jgi:hypothetical protein
LFFLLSQVVGPSVTKITNRRNGKGKAEKRRKEKNFVCVCVCVLTRYAVRSVTQKLRDGQLRAPSAKEKNFFFF